jgi:capsular exopolysaccharide synthesis family protein
VSGRGDDDFRVRDLVDGEPPDPEQRPDRKSQSRPDLPPVRTGAADRGAKIADDGPMVPQVVVETGGGAEEEQGGPILPVDLSVLLTGLRRRLPLILGIFAAFAVISLLAALAVRDHDWRVFATVLRKSEQKEFLVTGSNQPIVKLQTYTMPTLLRLVKATENLEQARAEAGMESVDTSELSRSILVENPKDTEIIEVIMDWPEPRQAEALVNSLVEVFVEHVDRLQKLEAIQAHDYLSGELETVRARIAELDDAFVSFKEEHEVIELSDQAGRLLQQIAEFDALASKERLDAEMAQRVSEQAQVELAGQQPTVVGSVYVRRPVQTRLVELETELAAAMSVYTDETPKVKELQDEIALVQDLVRRGVEEDLEESTISRNPVVDTLEQTLVDRRVEAVSRMARAEGYERVVEQMRERLLTLPDLERQFADLSQRLETLRQVEANLAKRVEEVRIIRDSTAANLSITQLAKVPKYPLPSKAKLLFAIGLVLGLGMAFVVALALELADTSLKTLAELEQTLAVPGLGEVPLLPPERVFVRDLDDSVTVEIYRQIASTLLLERDSASGWIVMVASADHYEGRTTTAVNLARLAAARGLTVCVVDADLRKPNLRELAPRFGVELSAGGLSAVLRGADSVEKALVETGFPGLTWLPVGSGAAPPELFDTGDLPGLLDGLRDRFDLVVVDTAPLLASADPLLVAPHVDSVVMVVEAFSLPRAAHREALRRLQSTGAQVLGALLNKVPPAYTQRFSVHSFRWREVAKGMADAT